MGGGGVGGGGVSDAAVCRTGRRKQSQPVVKCQLSHSSTNKPFAWFLLPPPFYSPPSTFLLHLSSLPPQLFPARHLTFKLS